MAATASSLPLGTRLEEFELTGVLGEGGFSVVYLAMDHSLGRTVAIKEYMPSAIATRMPDGTVAPKSQQHEETFQAGLRSFLGEARLLTRFTHAALIHVHRIWEQNGTAYMAMQYCVGKTLRQIRQAQPELVKNEAWLKAMIAPVLDALEILHSENCFHRDISPDNILVLQSGAPVLLDFGAARQIIGDMTQALTVILKPGFAPVEQYADDTSLQQGPWTDVYGVGAVLYYLLMGKPPVASVARLVKDPMIKLADAPELASLSRPFREAIARALAVYPQQRLQSIADLREALQLPTFNPGALYGSGVAHHAATAAVSEPPAPNHAGTALAASGVGDGSAGPQAAARLDDPPEQASTSLPATATTPKRSSVGTINAFFVTIGLFVVIAGIAVAAFSLSHHSPGSSADKASSVVPTPEAVPPTPDPVPPTPEAVPPTPDPVPPTPEAVPPTPEAVPPTPDPVPPTPDPVPPTPDPLPPTPDPLPPTPDPLPPTPDPLPPTSKVQSASRPVLPPVPVLFNIQPWAQVTVDGRDMGVSPPLKRLSLTPGKHRIRITNPAHPSVTKTIVVPKNGEVTFFHKFSADQ